MYQSITLVGNLGRDPEMRYTPSGQTVTNLNVAVDDSYTNSNGERVEQTTWFRVSVWGKLAEICNQYLAKGRKVLIVGTLAAGEPRVYKAGDGEHRASYEVRAMTVKFLSGRNDGNDSDGNEF